MNLKTIRYGIVILLGLLIILILGTPISSSLITVRKYPTAGLWSQALTNAIDRYKNGEARSVDLSTITNFSWDRLYIFGPYTDFSDIDDVAGKSWHDSCFTIINSSEGFALLVFTEKGQSVGCIEYPRDKADFALLASYKSGFSIQEAQFILNQHGQMVWINGK